MDVSARCKPERHLANVDSCDRGLGPGSWPVGVQRFPFSNAYPLYTCCWHGQNTGREAAQPGSRPHGKRLFSWSHSATSQRRTSIIHSDPTPLLVDLAMSNTTPTALSSFSPKLHATFEASLKEYEKKTEISLLTHPLMVQLQDCNSPAEILVVLRSQVPQPDSEQTTSADENLVKWLDPIVRVLSAYSPAISACVGLVSPIQVIFLQFNLKSYV